VRALSIVQERDAPGGVFADAAAAGGGELIEWVPAESPAPRPEGFGAVFVFGGAMHVDQEQEHPWLAAEKDLLREFLARGTPALGVCLGAQLLAEVAGGGATRGAEPEIGWRIVELTPEAAGDALLAPLPARFASFQWHSYEISPPPGGAVLARSASCVQAFRVRGVPWWGIQFHAEATANTIAGWVENYRSDEDAARGQLDWTELLSETSRNISRWNALGVAVCERFLGHAAAL
jgi:GMP synthase-like glutamine amidotransferase